MAVGFIQEWNGGGPGTENYDEIASRVNVQSDPPDGLIAHTAGNGSDGVWRIFDIWESREQAERFQRERLMPIINELMQQRDNMQPPDKMEFYELHDLVHP